MRSGVGKHLRTAACLAGVCLLLAGAACVSPEASRARGGSPGADPGNHGNPVELHPPKQNPYVDTPIYRPPGVSR
jgi:hypothetical protein